jgi:hypothetical protein
MILMKTSNCIINFVERCLCDDVAADKIAKLEERMECTDDIRWDIAFERWQVYLNPGVSFKKN